MINYKKIIPMRLEYLRNKYEFTQEEIAQKIGIKQPTYCNYEKGKHTPNLETICKIADIYNTSIDLLIGRTDIK